LRFTAFVLIKKLASSVRSHFKGSYFGTVVAEHLARLVLDPLAVVLAALEVLVEEVTCLQLRSSIHFKNIVY